MTRSHFNRSVSGEVPILIGTIPVRHVVPPQDLTVLNQDYLVPPQPTPLQKDESQPLLSRIFCLLLIISNVKISDNLKYADSVFGKGTLIEDKDDKSAAFIPKYIYYNDYQ